MWFWNTMFLICVHLMLYRTKNIYQKQLPSLNTFRILSYIWIARNIAICFCIETAYIEYYWRHFRNIVFYNHISHRTSFVNPIEIYIGSIVIYYRHQYDLGWNPAKFGIGSYCQIVINKDCWNLPLYFIDAAEDVCCSRLVLHIFQDKTPLTDTCFRCLPTFPGSNPW